jgi:hypothetical protein
MCTEMPQAAGRRSGPVIVLLCSLFNDDVATAEMIIVEFLIAANQCGVTHSNIHQRDQHAVR